MAVDRSLCKFVIAPSLQSIDKRVDKEVRGKSTHPACLFKVNWAWL
ncbi:hypothetical protein PFLA_b0491 [Pseudoalteromonas flavipulchra NCIMB 2033 = ATCC BAA-314]|nr:hypothetical protein [Pseudoalteromonas flavipulchra NCIMB 2033 = ATCC BAA-314]